MLEFLAQLLYPKRCVQCRKSGDYVCDRCFSGIAFLGYQFCGVCQKGSIDGMTHPKCKSRYGIDGIYSSIAYKGIVKKLLYQFKYPPYLSDLKGVLGRLLYEGIIQQEAFMNLVTKGNVVIASIPLHKDRERRRGYNQSELLARELSKLLQIKYIPNLLMRPKKTIPQFELKKEQRATNIIGAFEMNKKFKKSIQTKNIILIDDIATTGATLRECAKTLKRGGVGKVVGVTLAHEA